MTDAKLTVELLDSLHLEASAALANDLDAEVKPKELLALIAAARASLESRGGVFSGRPTFALVTENGWVHVVFNDEERAMEQAAKRSVPPAEVDPLTGKHSYTVMRYVPSAPSQPAESIAARELETHKARVDGFRFLLRAAAHMAEQAGDGAKAQTYREVEAEPLDTMSQPLPAPPEPTNGR